jgi:hypothetical protein
MPNGRARVLWAAWLALAACGGPTTTVYDILSQACVDHINALRATVGLGPLARLVGAEACADGQSQSESITYPPAHQAFGRCQESAQDECPGWGSLTGAAGIVPGCLDAMWGEGPGGGHYDIMTSTAYSIVACGFFVAADGTVWSVQDFR